MKHLSVAKKVWLLLLVVMGLLIASNWGMQHYTQQLEEKTRAEVRDMEERIRLVTELRGQVEVGATFLVAANMVEAGASGDFFASKYQDALGKITALMQETGQRLQSPQGRAQFDKIKASVERVRGIADQIAQTRSAQGDVGGVVMNQLVPSVVQYLQELQELVTMQHALMKTVLEQKQSERQTAAMVGLAVEIGVVLLGVLIAVWLVRQLTAPLQRAVSLAESIAEGDLTRDIHDDRQDELGHLLRSLSTMAQRLRAVVGEVRNGVDSVSSAASQIASGNQDLSARTEQTAANLEETAASIEELTATVTQSADTARQANQLAATAVQAAERGGQVVNEVVMSMDQINTSSRKINDIIGVIDGIAFQTNILALNAAVEAARAGEQGRGFAVVAGEVRSLAQRSAEAAKEIKGLITTSVQNVSAGAHQVEQAGASMQEIVTSVRRVTDLIGEITASSDEQRDGIGQVNQAVSNLDQMTQQNASLVEESSAAALAMNEQAQRLAQVVAVFNVGPSSQVVGSYLPTAVNVPRAAPQLVKRTAGKQEPSAQQIVNARKV